MGTTNILKIFYNFFVFNVNERNKLNFCIYKVYLRIWQQIDFKNKINFTKKYQIVKLNLKSISSQMYSSTQNQNFRKAVEKQLLFKTHVVTNDYVNTLKRYQNVLKTNFS